MASIRYSQVAEWLTCRYRWQVRNERHLVARVDAPAPQLGSAIHKALEYMLLRKAKGNAPKKWGTWARKGIEAWIAEYQELRELSEAELDELATIAIEAETIALRAWDTFDPDQWEILVCDGKPMVEFEAQVPIAPIGEYDTLECHFDLVARNTKTDLTWIIDFKTRAAFRGDDDQETNLQFIMYQFALRRLGVEVAGSMTYQIRNKVPAWPRLNVNGTMSRADIASDWPTYWAALVDAGLDPDDYADMQAKLEAKEWFRWSPAYRSDEEVLGVWNGVVRPAIRGIAAATSYQRSFGGFSCKICWARSLCLAELKGYDTDDLISAEYVDTTKVAVLAEQEYDEELETALASRVF